MPVPRPQAGTKLIYAWRDLYPLCDALDQDEQMISQLFQRLAAAEQQIAAANNLAASLSNIIVRQQGANPLTGKLDVADGYSVLSF